MSAPAAKPLVIGKPLDRVDGRLKVTGKALYAAEVLPPKCLHAFPVFSTIARGTITSIDLAKAEKSVGVRAILTHLNVPKIDEPRPAGMQARGGMRTEERLPLKDEKIHYAGQFVALAVADTLEQARYAASLVRISYAEEEAIIGLAEAQAESKKKKPSKNNGEPVQQKKGDVEAAFANSEFVQIQQTYTTPQETHSPIEMSATVAVWNDEKHLTLYDATQYVKGVQDVVSLTFDLPKENVRVISPFVGGAFGCKGSVWPHVILTAMAAKFVGAPVKFMVPRMGMFTTTGHRTPTKQTLTLAASRDGKLQGIRHYSETFTSEVGQYTESCGSRSTGVLYQSPNILIEEVVYPTNLPTPTFMRAPGECPGSFAADCAIDELSYALEMDPLVMRELNHSDTHPIKEKPWSTKFLREAYKLGAEKFGWEKRTPKPGSMKDGNLLVGWGVGTATYPANKWSADAKARINLDGTAVVQCATHDLGTGAYTAFTQISAEALGIPVDKVTFELGDSNLPYGPVAGGSNSTATVGTAIYLAADAVHLEFAKLAVADSQSPLSGLKPEEITLLEPGRLGLKNDTGKSDTFSNILQRSGKDYLEALVRSEAENPSKSPTVFQSFGVHFCEVKINPRQPRVQVTRVVSVMDCGRVMNAKTANSQIIGGVVMGIGMALSEESVTDERSGQIVTRNLSDYHVAVHADVPALEAWFVGEPDFAFNPTGGRGLGEIGNTGIAAAIANAVYHATGKRVRDLPITPDKLL